jgi:hypothetical protein
MKVLNCEKNFRHREKVIGTGKAKVQAVRNEIAESQRMNLFQE